MKGDRLDDAIDAVVRDIMRTEPPAGLRARVMGQLSRPERRVWLTVPRLAAAAVFAVCVVAGLVVTRERQPGAVRTGPHGRCRSRSSSRYRDRGGRVRRSRSLRPDRGGRPSPPGARRLHGHSAGRRAASSRRCRSTSPRRRSPSRRCDDARDHRRPDRVVPGLRSQETAIRPLAIEPVRIDPLPSPPR